MDAEAWNRDSREERSCVFSLLSGLNCADEMDLALPKRSWALFSSCAGAAWRPWVRELLQGPPMGRV